MKGFRAALALALFALPAFAAVAQSSSVVVEKVANCSGFPWAPPGCLRTQDDYWAWKDHGVPIHTQVETYIGRYNEPDRNRTRNLVFVAPGQRFGPKAGNWVTGQYDFSPFALYDGKQRHSIQDQSIPFRVFSQGIYSRDDTFVGIAYDARYNFEFQPSTLEAIAGAYYAWLKSKVADHSQLRSVYLAGHSRGGALVLRLAQKFKREFPHTIVIVDAFEPVARKNFGELGTYDDYIDNPAAGFPRDSGGLDDLGNWSWKTDLREQFPDKTNLSLINRINGGQIPLAQDTRSLTHAYGQRQHTDLGWLRQQWYAVGGNAQGHEGIASQADAVDDALDHLADRLDLLEHNLAPLASVSASSTYGSDCYGQSNDCYGTPRVNDRNLDSRLGGYYSWTNQGYQSVPQWLELRWALPVRTGYLEVISSDGYELQQVGLQYWDDAGGSWQPLAAGGITNGTTTRFHFRQVDTTAVRLVDLLGPAHQPGYFRVNEVLVRGEFAPLPNVAPQAVATASSTYCSGSCYSPAKANDGDLDTRLGDQYSWVNDAYQSEPQWLELSWPAPISTSSVEVYSSQGYALRGFQVEYHDGSQWRPVPAQVSSRFDVLTVVSFGQVRTQRLRLAQFVGSEAQPYYYRVNEFVVYGR